jgi:hypothetical protein
MEREQVRCTEQSRAPADAMSPFREQRRSTARCFPPAVHAVDRIVEDTPPDTEVSPPAADPLSECSRDGLRILISYLLADGSAAGTVSTCELICSWTEAAASNRSARIQLDDLLERRLACSARRLAGKSLFELAQIWSAEREALQGRELAALLWFVCRCPCPVYRKFELALLRWIDSKGRWPLLDPGAIPVGF